MVSGLVLIKLGSGDKGARSAISRKSETSSSREDA